MKNFALIVISLFIVSGAFAAPLSPQYAGLKFKLTPADGGKAGLLPIELEVDHEGRVTSEGRDCVASALPGIEAEITHVHCVTASGPLKVTWEYVSDDILDPSLVSLYRRTNFTGNQRDYFGTLHIKRIK